MSCFPISIFLLKILISIVLFSYTLPCGVLASYAFNNLDNKKQTLKVCFLLLMAGTTRLELATSCVTGMRSNQLSYAPIFNCHSSFQIWLHLLYYLLIFFLQAFFIFYPKSTPIKLIFYSKAFIIFIIIRFCSTDTFSNKRNIALSSSRFETTGSSPKLNKYVKGTCKLSANLKRTFDDGKL